MYCTCSLGGRSNPYRLNPLSTRRAINTSSDQAREGQINNNQQPAVEQEQRAPLFFVKCSYVCILEFLTKPSSDRNTVLWLNDGSKMTLSSVGGVAIHPPRWKNEMCCGYLAVKEIKGRNCEKMSSKPL